MARCHEKNGKGWQCKLKPAKGELYCQKHLAYHRSEKRREQFKRYRSSEKGKAKRRATRKLTNYASDKRYNASEKGKATARAVNAKARLVHREKIRQRQREWYYKNHEENKRYFRERMRAKQADPAFVERTNKRRNGVAQSEYLQSLRKEKHVYTYCEMGPK